MYVRIHGMPNIHRYYNSFVVIFFVQVRWIWTQCSNTMPVGYGQYTCSNTQVGNKNYYEYVNQCKILYLVNNVKMEVIVKFVSGMVFLNEREHIYIIYADNNIIEVFIIIQKIIFWRCFSYLYLPHVLERSLLRSKCSYLFSFLIYWDLSISHFTIFNLHISALEFIEILMFWSGKAWWTCYSKWKVGTYIRVWV